jgi:prolyl-tRNA synthetase
MIVDRDAAVGFDDAKAKSMFWVTGGDKKDYHVKHFNWQRDLGKDPLDAQGFATDKGFPVGGLRGGDKDMVVADIRNAMVGDPSPKLAGEKLTASRGIEVGHIFKLGTKYSEAMGLQILDEKQQKQTVIMGCYGIGVSRTMAACVEMSHDENGPVWPNAIAPYHVILCMLQPADAAQQQLCKQLASELSAAGVDVLIDDRDDRPGPKFKDADLTGIPIRVTLADKALAAGGVEFKLRRDKTGKGEIVAVADVVAKCVATLNS